MWTVFVYLEHLKVFINMKMHKGNWSFLIISLLMYLHNHVISKLHPDNPYFREAVEMNNHFML